MGATGTPIAITAEEAQALLEEKTQRTRAEMNQIHRQAQDAQSQLDKATSEVTALQREKNKIIDEIEGLKQESERIKGMLAEHRKNVEASLTKQEDKARAVIDKSHEIENSQRERENKLKQQREQLEGIKNTLQNELSKIVPIIKAATSQVQESIDAIL